MLWAFFTARWAEETEWKKTLPKPFFCLKLLKEKKRNESLLHLAELDGKKRSKWEIVPYLENSFLK